MDVTTRTAHEDEFLAVYKFVSNCQPLERYSEHFFKILLRYFGNCCFIAEHADEIVGIIIGMVSRVDVKTYFIWQIGVDPSLRGEGIAKKLLEYAEVEVKNLGCDRIEVTVDPKNIPSKRLFEKKGYNNISSREGETTEIMGSTTVKDYYKPGRHFILFEKKLN